MCCACKYVCVHMCGCVHISRYIVHCMRSISMCVHVCIWMCLHLWECFRVSRCADAHRDVNMNMMDLFVFSCVCVFLSVHLGVCVCVYEQCLSFPGSSGLSFLRLRLCPAGPISQVFVFLPFFSGGVFLAFLPFSLTFPFLLILFSPFQCPEPFRTHRGGW